MGCLTMKRLLFLLLVMFLNIGVVRAQVTLSPTAIFFENNFSSLVVINNSTITQDILIDFFYGYPKADELGFVSINYNSENVTDDISSYIRAFPRSLTLQPGQRQTVRLNIRPPRDIPDGVYSARIRVTSTPESAEIAESEVSSVVTQLNFKFEQVLGLYYRKGSVSLSLGVDNIRYIQQNDDLLLFDVNIDGNAPFLGRISAKVFNSNNNLVYENSSVTSLFISETRNFQISEKLNAGTYRVVLNFEASRPDIPSNQNFPMDPVTYEQAITIP